jgi:predicted phosphoribosyltransferase
MRYADRVAAGESLAGELTARGERPDVVLGLPRGGVVVAAEVARGAGGSLDVWVARKVGAPGQPELGIGAVGEGGTVVRDDVGVRSLGLAPGEFDALAAEERVEVERRVRRYRGERGRPDVRGRAVVVVDDGVATGVTAECALRDVRAMGPSRLVLAVPVCARDTAGRLRDLVDDLVCPLVRADLLAVGQWYDRFDQTTDDEVVALLPW